MGKTARLFLRVYHPLASALVSYRLPASARRRQAIASPQSDRSLPHQFYSAIALMPPLLHLTINTQEILPIPKDRKTLI